MSGLPAAQHSASLAEKAQYWFARTLCPVRPRSSGRIASGRSPLITALAGPLDGPPIPDDAYRHVGKATFCQLLIGRRSIQRADLIHSENTIGGRCQVNRAQGRSKAFLPTVSNRQQWQKGDSLLNLQFGRPNSKSLAMEMVDRQRRVCYEIQRCTKSVTSCDLPARRPEGAPGSSLLFPGSGSLSRSMMSCLQHDRLLLPHSAAALRHPESRIGSRCDLAPAGDVKLRRSRFSQIFLISPAVLGRFCRRSC